MIVNLQTLILIHLNLVLNHSCFIHGFWFLAMNTLVLLIWGAKDVPALTSKGDGEEFKIVATTLATILITSAKFLRAKGNNAPLFPTNCYFEICA